MHVNKSFLNQIIQEEYENMLQEIEVSADADKGTVTVGDKGQVKGGKASGSITTGEGGTGAKGAYTKGGTSVSGQAGRGDTHVKGSLQKGGTAASGQVGGKAGTQAQITQQVAPGTKVQAQAGGGDTKIAASHRGSTKGGTQYGVSGQVGGQEGTHVKGDISGKRGSGQAKLSGKGLQASGRVKTGKDSEVRGSVDTDRRAASVGGTKTFKHKGGGKTTVTGDVGTEGAAGGVEHTTKGGTTVGAKGKLPPSVLMRRQGDPQAQIYAKHGGVGGRMGYGRGTGVSAGAHAQVAPGLQAQIDYDQRGEGAGSKGRIGGRLQHKSGLYAQGSTGLGKGGDTRATVGGRWSFEESIVREEHDKLLMEVIYNQYLEGIFEQTEKKAETPPTKPAAGGTGLSDLAGALKKGVSDVVGGAKAIGTHVAKGITDPKYAATAKRKEATSGVEQSDWSTSTGRVKGNPMASGRGLGPSMKDIEGQIATEKAAGLPDPEPMPAASTGAEDTEAEIAKHNIRSAAEAGGAPPGEAMAQAPAGKSDVDVAAKELSGQGREPWGTAASDLQTKEPEAPKEKKSYGQGRRDINAAYKAGKIDKSEWRKQRRAHAKTKPARSGGGGKRSRQPRRGRAGKVLRRTTRRPRRRRIRENVELQENQMLLSNTPSTTKEKDPSFTSYPDQKNIFDNWRDFIGEQE